MMAGPFSTVAEKRAHEMAANRAVSLDMTPKTAPASANNTPVHHSSDALATAAAVTLINSGRATKPSSPTNYFRPAHSQITFGKMSFLITHMPTENTIETYISVSTNFNPFFSSLHFQDLERHRANTLVRVCDPTYSAEEIRRHGIKVYDWKFEDGGWPTNDIIQKFLQLCLEVFTSSNDTIAIHCVAGLGRSPILVAIALVEAGCKADDAIFLIRRWVLLFFAGRVYTSRLFSLRQKCVVWRIFCKQTGKRNFVFWSPKIM